MMTKDMEVKLKLSILREIAQLKLELSWEMVKSKMTMLMRLRGGTAEGKPLWCINICDGCLQADARIKFRQSTVTSLFSPFPAKFSRSKFISSFHNIFTPTTCSILFSLDSALPTQPKLFFSTALTSGIRPLTPRSMWVQYSSTYPRPSTLSATSYFYPNSPA